MLESAHYATGCEGREHPHPSQPLLAILLGAQTCSPDRHLLPVHHTVAVLFSPAVSAPCGMLLVTLACQVPYFFLHHQVHQGKTGRAQQVADSFLQKTHDLGHGKDHLDVGILFVGQLAELLHRSLLVDLVSSFHSDSLLFLGRKNHPRPIMTADVRVATFYELTGILQTHFGAASENISANSERLRRWGRP